MVVVKIIRIIGNSPQSWAKAAAAGAKEAARTVRNITGIEATDFTAQVDERGNVTEYRCTLNVAFLLDRQGGEGGGGRGRSGGEGGGAPAARSSGAKSRGANGGGRRR